MSDVKKSSKLVARYRRHPVRFLPALFVLAVLSLVPAGQLLAQGSFGFGIVVGQPTGLAWKYRTSHFNAVDGAIGFTPNDNRFRMHVDYLWQSYPFSDGNLALHYGLGVAFGAGDEGNEEFEGNDDFFRNEEVGFGARMVGGLTYTIPRSPVDLFFEVAPLFVMAPETGMGIDLGLGVRIYP